MIEILDLGVELIIPLRSDGHEAVTADLAYIRREFENTTVGDFLAIPNLHQPEISLRGGVHEDRCDNEGTKVVALTGFVDTDSGDGSEVRRRGQVVKLRISNRALI